MNIKGVVSLILICFNLISCSPKPTKEQLLIPEDISDCMDYDGFYYSETEITAVMKNGNWGFIDSDGNTVIPFEYKNMSYMQNNFAIVKKNGKYGIINMKNEIIIPFEYDSITSFNTGCYIIEKNNKEGLINSKGETVLVPEYDRIHADFFSDSHKFFYIQKNNKCGIVDITGEIIIPMIYDFLTNGDMAKTNTFIVARVDNKYGVLDYSGNILLPFEYDSMLVAGEKIVSVDKNKKHAVIDVNGNIIAPYGNKGYEPIGEGFFTKGSIFDEDGLTLLNSEGKEILPHGKGNGIKAYNCGYIKIITPNGVALCDFNGKKVTASDNNKIYERNHGYFLIEKNDGSHILWKDGKEIKLEYKITEMFGVDKDGLICAANKNLDRVYVFSPEGKLMRCFNGTLIKSINNYYFVEQNIDGNINYKLVPKSK